MVAYNSESQDSRTRILLPLVDRAQQSMDYTNRLVALMAALVQHECVQRVPVLHRSSVQLQQLHVADVPVLLSVSFESFQTMLCGCPLNDDHI